MYIQYKILFVVCGFFATAQASYWVVPQHDANISLNQSVYWRSESAVINYIKNNKVIVDINTQDAQGDTALITASRCGKIQVVRALLKKGAIMSIKNNSNKNALQVAMNREVFDELDSHIVR